MQLLRSRVLILGFAFFDTAQNHTPRNMFEDHVFSEGPPAAAAEGEQRGLANDAAARNLNPPLSL
eukprot:3894295-Pyramimonas_sp.AAC.1